MPETLLEEAWREYLAAAREEASEEVLEQAWARILPVLVEGEELRKEDVEEHLAASSVTEGVSQVSLEPCPEGVPADQWIVA